MGEGTAIVFQLDPDKGGLLLTTEQAARMLARHPSEFSRLLKMRDDPAVRFLEAGRSGTGKLTRWYFPAVARAAESLAGREWPVRRGSAA